MTQWISTLLSSIIVAVIAAQISVRLALRRFRTEKWWERKAEAYSRIVEALHSLVVYYDAKVAEEYDQVTHTEDFKKRLNDESDRAIHELRKATGVGAFIISNEAAEALARIYESEVVAYKKSLSEIRGLAKKDLAV
jgi:hypothetical protein